jgi:putative endonuclease
MALHNELGRQGEEWATRYLVQQGYRILHRNWRYSRYEIDILALKDGILHVVEVKLRTNSRFGPPEEQVTKKKFRALCLGAEAFLFQHPQYNRVQFDILAIRFLKGPQPEICFLPDVFMG